jgi:hypothetical protein
MAISFSVAVEDHPSSMVMQEEMESLERGNVVVENSLSRRVHIL